MQDLIQPIKTNSIKDEFISRMENLILSGKLKPGQKLLPERELARQFNISRPIVHEGIVNLVAKGLLTMVPRHGTTVNDYRKEGNISLLSTLLDYQAADALDPKILGDLLSFRKTFEIQMAQLCVIHCNEKDLENFYQLLVREKSADHTNPAAIAEIDYSFHLQIASVSANMLYPLLMNSMKKIYLLILTRFYQNTSIIPNIFNLHEDLVSAFQQKIKTKAVDIMHQILDLGENELRKQLSKHEK
ncbi:MAG: GntR family transcriptional regulator [Spirochaetes bacterium]|nr:GntR family transcriptional regulator [Spirochaetota bacterium]